MTREQALRIRIGDTITTSTTHSLDQFRGATFVVVGLEPISVQRPLVGALTTNKAIESHLASLPPAFIEADEWGYTDVLMRVCVESRGTWGAVAHLMPSDISAVKSMAAS